MLGPSFESRFFPALNGYSIEVVEILPDGRVQFRPVFDRNRLDCSFVGLTLYAQSEGRTHLVALKPPHDNIRNRVLPTIGTNTGSIWEGGFHVFPNDKQFTGVVQHKCWTPWTIKYQVTITNPVYGQFKPVE